MKVIWRSLLGLFILYVGYCVLNGGIFSRSRIRASAAIGSADQDLRELERALEHYQDIGGDYPSNEQGLKALVIRPETEPLPERWVQLLYQEISTDPWDTPFRYRYPGTVNPDKPEIVTAGPDKMFGTEDDMSNQD